MDSNYISPLLFMTDYSLEQELFQKVMEIIDYTECRGDSSSAIFEEINQAYSDLYYKYTDISKLSEECLRSRIKEAGFESLLNLFNYTKDQLILIIGYLPLIKLFRGTKTGLEIILQLFSSEYELTEYWEDPLNLDEYMFDITLLRILNVSINADISSRFIAFCRHYVYPVLRDVSIHAQFKYSNIYAHAMYRYQYSVTVYCE